jgi:hypothetical protein
VSPTGTKGPYIYIYIPLVENRPLVPVYLGPPRGAARGLVVEALWSRVSATAEKWPFLCRGRGLGWSSISLPRQSFRVLYYSFKYAMHTSFKKPQNHHEYIDIIMKYVQYT